MEIEEIKKLEFEEDDILVFKMKHIMPTKNRNDIQKMLREYLEHKKILVIDSQVSISVLAKKEIDNLIQEESIDDTRIDEGC
jgi:hypothetical protein